MIVSHLLKKKKKNNFVQSKILRIDFRKNVVLYIFTLL